MINDRLPKIIPNQNSLPASGSNTGAQERFSETDIGRIRKSFALRFKQAFDHANNAEIARRLKTSDSTVKPYSDGNRLPTPEMLIEIKRVTGASIDWLLTGQGTRHTKVDDLFTEDEEAEISEIAKESKQSFDQTVKSLALAAVRFIRQIKG